MAHTNAQIQANAIELIQTIVARGELEAPKLEAIEAAVVGKLYASVHLGRVDLQNKLLHVLHSLVSASSVVEADLHHPHASGSRTDLLSHSEEAHIPEDTARLSSFTHLNPLLVQTLIDGITKGAGRPILQHWLDFVLMTVPQFPRLSSSMVFPLSDCICRQLRHALVDLNRILNHDSSRLSSATSGTTDAEFIMLLNGLERLVLLGITRTHDTAGSEEEIILDRSVQESSSGSSGGLLGIVSNVFSSDNPGNPVGDNLSASLVNQWFYATDLPLGTFPGLSSPARRC